MAAIHHNPITDSTLVMEPAMLTPIPCLLMRGGTSKGPFFLADDLPADPDTRNAVLLSVMGSPDLRQIDGIGGGDSLTSKVAIVSRSQRPGIDVEYLFAQVSVGQRTVDTTPNCGNMLSGVGPFAIEQGLVAVAGPVTPVRIYNVNTGKVVEALVPTPGGEVTYEGEVHIDGVPGAAAGIVLNFLDAAGAKTGKLLPTGAVLDQLYGIPVSCVDFSTPLVLVAAADLGISGYESKAELDANRDLLGQLETLRQAAALRMGLGNVSNSVLPKIAVLAPPSGDGSISSRYFTPWNCHAAHAVTGALCVAAASLIPGTVAARLVRLRPDQPERITIEHPSGSLDTQAELEPGRAGEPPSIRRIGIVRTARPLFSGRVLIPGSVWKKAS
jgi:2-methylaconitate cis-trans-isomerase PrpF